MAFEACSRLSRFLLGLGNAPDVLPVLEAMIEVLAPLADEHLSALEILNGVNEKRIEILKEHDPAAAEQVALELEQQKILYAARHPPKQPQH